MRDAASRRSCCGEHDARRRRGHSSRLGCQACLSSSTGPTRAASLPTGFVPRDERFGTRSAGAETRAARYGRRARASTTRGSGSTRRRIRPRARAGGNPASSAGDGSLADDLPTREAGRVKSDQERGNRAACATARVALVLTRFEPAAIKAQSLATRGGPAAMGARPSTRRGSAPAPRGGRARCSPPTPAAWRAGSSRRCARRAPRARARPSRALRAPPRGSPAGGRF